MMKFRYIYYHLKALLKRRSTWAVVVTVVFLVFVYWGITFPSIDNTFIGVVTADSERACSIIESIEGRSSLYGIKRYDSADELKNDVMSGKLECGFVFDDNFDRMVDKGKLKNLIEYVHSPYTTKGLAAKETVFSAFLENYSNDVIQKEYGKIFGSFDDETKDDITKSIKESNEYYLEGNEIFDIESVYY